MKIILYAVCCFGGSALAQQSPCSGLESGVEAEVLRVGMAEDDLGAFRAVGDKALAALRHCPQSVRLWYLAARSAEVVEILTNGQAFAASGGLKKIVADALSHAPSSAQVVTVAARVQGSSALARRAIALDPRYHPARRALADLLAKEGGIDEALRLASVNPVTGPMLLTRARVLLAAKRPAEAVAEAKRVMKSGEADELSPRVEMYRDSQEVLGFALLSLQRRAEAEKALRAAAAAGSITAQRYLTK